MNTFLAFLAFLKKYDDAPLSLLLNSATFLIVFLGTLFSIYFSRETLKYAFDKDMKPVLLREGFLNGFSSVPIVDASKPINLDMLPAMLAAQNIATSISGRIVIDGVRYKLLFATMLRKISYDKDGKFIEVPLLAEGRFRFSPPQPRWSWIPQGERLFFMADQSSRAETREKNLIEIDYSSASGQKFRFVEDESFSQSISLN